MQPFWGLKSYFLIAGLSGHSLRRHYAQLQDFYQLPADQQEAYRTHRLRALIAHAEKHVPFYKRRFSDSGVEVAGVRDLVDLQHFPILSKADTRNQTTELLSERQ